MSVIARPLTCPRCEEGWALCTCEVAKPLMRETPHRDMVDHPPHYTTGAVEALDAIESALGPEGFKAYLRGQILKYTWRGPHKGSEAEDYRKAEFYLKRLIERSEGAK